MLRRQNFVKKILEEAATKLTGGGLKKEERWLMQWMLGLTDKGVQNILRDDHVNLEKYKQDFIVISKKAIDQFSKEYGPLAGEIQLNNESKVMINWEFMVHLMNTVGSQTLAIRGSDKSTFGKLFEKLILGTLLSILGFKMIDENEIKDTKKVFWLSSRSKKRESDATLLYEAGKGVRFDIGFIGRGNPEISLDKVSRFEREIEFGRTKFYMGTIIIVDRIGANSRIEDLAKQINGYVVQMSGSFWPIKVAAILNKTFGYQDPILEVPPDRMEKYLKEMLDRLDFDRILNMPTFSENLVNNVSLRFCSSSLSHAAFLSVIFKRAVAFIN